MSFEPETYYDLVPICYLHKYSINFILGQFFKNKNMQFHEIRRKALKYAFCATSDETWVSFLYLWYNLHSFVFTFVTSKSLTNQEPKREKKLISFQSQIKCHVDYVSLTSVSKKLGQRAVSFVRGHLYITYLRTQGWVGEWSRKWQFCLTLCNENVLRRWFKKGSKHPYVI